MAGSGTTHLRSHEDALLRVEDLVVQYKAARGQVHAASSVSFDVLPGETLGIVGESGCGKSSVARAVLQVPPPTAGSVTLGGVELTSLKARDLRAIRSRLQMVFQDPISSLNPRRRVRDIVAEGLVIRGESRDQIQAKVAAALDAVGLGPELQDRRPYELSGGQCQRVSIARALVLEPELVICDEPVSALDVSVQAQILNVLESMKVRYGLTLVFIAHDLAVVKNVSDRILVMYLGKVCEVGTSHDVYEHPHHHYSAGLIESLPEPDPDMPVAEQAILGDPPSALSPPSGCRFHPRCPAAQERCMSEEPHLHEVGPDHYVACHFPAFPT